MQILMQPDLPTRDLDWYKTRYEGLREDIVRQNESFEILETENKSFQKHIDVMQTQLDSAKDLIDVLWQTVDELTPNGMNRLVHDESYT